MRKSLIFVCAAFLLGGENAFSIEPPASPSPYGNGPDVANVEKTDLSESEKIAITLLEGVLHVAEAKVDASSCADSVGEYPLTVLSDVNFNMFELSVLSLGGSYKLVATPQSEQQIDISDKGIGFFSGMNVGGFVAQAIYNPTANNMISQENAVSIVGKNGIQLDRYHSLFSGIFYNGSEGVNVHEVYGSGLQYVRKVVYPISKYWHRLKIHRGSGRLARTVIVKDLIAGGDKSCRVMVDVSGTNDGLEFFFQSGRLVVTILNPSAPTPELIQPPFFL